MKNILLPLFVACLFVLPVAAQTDVAAIRSRAQELQRSNKPAEAAAEMGKLVALEPNNVRYLFDQAEYFERAKDEAGVLNNVDRAVKLEPDSEATLVDAVKRLIASATNERLERALAVTNTFITSHSQSDKAYWWRFFVKSRLRDEVGAFNDISMAAQLNPSDATYQLKRAEIATRIGDTKLAQQILAELAETLQTNLAKADSPKAQDEIKLHLGSVFGQLAVVYERSGDKTLTIKALTQAITFDTDFYLRNRAFAYERFGMYKDALTDLELAIAHESERQKAEPGSRHDMTLIGDRANVFFHLGEYQRALTDLRECIRLDPKSKIYYEKTIDRINETLEKPN